MNNVMPVMIGANSNASRNTQKEVNFGSAAYFNLNKDRHFILKPNNEIFLLVDLLKTLLLNIQKVKEKPQGSFKFNNGTRLRLNPAVEKSPESIEFISQSGDKKILFTKEYKKDYGIGEIYTCLKKALTGELKVD